jgi:hypothetical protein
VVPAKGADDEPFSIRTSGACPLPARNVIGRIYGAGFPADGVNVIGNSSGGVSPDGAFEMPLLQTLRDTMVQQKKYVPLHGVYKLVLRCIIPAYVDRSYGDYVAKIRFLDPQHWVAMKAVTNVVGPHSNPDGTMTGPSAPGRPGTVTTLPPKSAATPGSGQDGAPASPGRSAAGSATTTDDAATGSGSSWPAVVLIGGGVLIAGLTVLLLRKGRAA